jgi:4,5-dihydroxyphthalate decarboxylase
MRLDLTFASSRNPRIAAVLDAECVPEGVDLIPLELQAPDVFWRQLRFQEFDVSEMSLSSLLMLLARGDDTWVALPVFPDRRFFHTFAMVRTDAGIQEIADLKGRKVGVPDYQQTAALWTRFALSRFYGVEAADLQWFMERTPKLSHAGGVGFHGPEGVSMDYIPEEESIGSRLTDGTLDAAIVYEPALLFNDEPTTVDRSPATLPPSVATWMFPDRVAETRLRYEEVRFTPANHCIVVRRELVDRHPWLALNIFDAFRESKRRYDEALVASLTLHTSLGYATFIQDGVIMEDPYPYGVTANKAMLETLVAEAQRQGLCGRTVALEEIFAGATMQL